jgi:5-methylcytosine-specific restriction endonuclease McrA
VKKKVSKSKDRFINIRELIRLYGRRCWYCGQRIDYGGMNESIQEKVYDSTRIEIDHIISKSQGGDDSLDNLALACGNCNKAKWNQGILEFLKWLAHIRSSRFQCLILGKLPKEIVDKLEPTEWDRLKKEFFR